MNTIDALLTRNSAPRLTTPIPTEDQLEIAYKCALRAPDHAWIRPWKFIQISGKGLDRLSKAFVNTAKKIDKNVDPEILKKYKDAPYRAPLIIVLVADTKEHPKVPVIEQQLSTATAGQNMLLAFHEMGFGGIWRTGKFSFNKEISMELDLKENEIVIGYLYIGTVEGKTKKIPELSTKDFVVTWE
ncbi:MAG: nitroreductase [Gammaproteobacteria bacterium]|jgi:nitroreductase|tara:strand:+ start:263 stop:820 length:558 start_codon:yes stop_codon:yes gene_type:complete